MLTHCPESTHLYLAHHRNATSPMGSSTSQNRANGMSGGRPQQPHDSCPYSRCLSSLFLRSKALTLDDVDDSVRARRGLPPGSTVATGSSGACIQRTPFSNFQPLSAGRARGGQAPQPGASYYK